MHTVCKTVLNCMIIGYHGYNRLNLLTIKLHTWHHMQITLWRKCNLKCVLFILYFPHISGISKKNLIAKNKFAFLCRFSWLFCFQVKRWTSQLLRCVRLTSWKLWDSSLHLCPRWNWLATNISEIPLMENNACDSHIVHKLN